MIKTRPHMNHPVRGRKGAPMRKNRPKARITRKRRKKSPLTKAKDKCEEVQKELTIMLYGRDCYTCPQKNLTGQNCQLGHVPYPRAALWVQYIFDVRLTRIQCFNCNINCGGMGAVALERMKSEGFDPLPIKRHSDSMKGTPVPIQWFKDKTTEYSTLLEELQK